MGSGHDALDSFTSPAAIAGAGAAGAVLLALGTPIGAVAAGAVAVAGAIGGLRLVRSGGSRGRRRRASRPVRLSPAWRRHVEEAADAHRRYLDATERVDDDALRDSLDRIGRRLASGVETTRRIAERGQQLDDALEALGDPGELDRRMAGLRARGIGHDDPRWTSLAYQRDTHERIRTQRDEVLDRLATLDAQLDAAVVRAIEAGLQADHPRIGELGDAVDAAVDDLEALNLALGEIDEIR